MQDKFDNYEFTNQWFEKTEKPIWSQIINQNKPEKILEIVSHQGASTCYLIDTLSFHNDAF